MESTASLDLVLARIVEEYRVTGNIGTLLDRVRVLALDADPEQLAQAMVVLANAYWLTGRGPGVVGELAQRAKEADPQNRGAWHLWALAEPDVRRRVDRWLEVTRTFPQDLLARAALADNATSLAGA